MPIAEIDRVQIFEICMTDLKATTLGGLDKFRKAAKAALLGTLHRFHNLCRSDDPELNPFTSHKPDPNQTRLMGMYFSQANSKAGYELRWQQTRERRNGKFSQNRSWS